KLGVEKALVFVHEHYPESVATSFPIKAILLPKITDQSLPRLREISPAQCLTLLAPSSIFNLPTAGEDDFRYLARFVRRVPSYVLELGADLSAVPDLVTGLLSSPSVST
ncbi:MAG: serine kinase, partial [Anaerolineae bacterium]|nr:serine kinase [Anaerolineae bacterium]